MTELSVVAADVTPKRRVAVDRSQIVQKITLTLAFFVLSVVILWSFFPSLFTSFDPAVGVTSDKYQPPSVQHFFGTDKLGRDLFARVVYGSFSSVSSALVAVTIGLIVGSLIGLLTGFFGKYTDAVLSRFVDVLLAIPSFMLAIIIVSSLGFATINAAVATGISSIAVFARLLRSEVIRIKHLSFVESSFLVGGNGFYVLFRHILPNAYRSVFALSILQFGLAIIVISSLAFLGYGDPPPASDWGLLVAEGKDQLKRYPWAVFAPGLVIAVTVLSLYRVSRIFGQKTEIVH